MRGRAIKATPSEEYAARKALLTDRQALLSLELAEEGIAVDPWHRVNRIMISYVVVDDEVLLLTFRDIFET